MDIKMVSILLIYIFLSVGGLILFKIGSEREFAANILNGSLNLNVNGFVILGLLFYMCSFILYMFLVSQYDLSYIAPISMGLAQVATVAGAIIFLKDRVDLFQLIGITFIIVGIVLTNMKRTM